MPPRNHMSSFLLFKNPIYNMFEQKTWPVKYNSMEKSAKACSWTYPILQVFSQRKKRWIQCWKGLLKLELKKQSTPHMSKSTIHKGEPNTIGFMYFPNPIVDISSTNNLIILQIQITRAPLYWVKHEKDYKNF